MAKKPSSEASERPADTGLRGETPGHDLNDDQIRERAYLIWVDEGRPSGRELDHWLRAKWELGREPKKGVGDEQAGIRTHSANADAAT